MSSVLKRFYFYRIYKRASTAHSKNSNAGLPSAGSHLCQQMVLDWYLCVSVNASGVGGSELEPPASQFLVPR